MSLSKGQGELFEKEEFLKKSFWQKNEILMKKEEIEFWQKKINNYQQPLLENNSKKFRQGSIFQSVTPENQTLSTHFLKLTPLPMSFWRWPHTPHHGPAMYIVMDKIKRLDSHIVLYIGETMAAEKRWKGDHDCKNYLQAYCEACQKTGLTTQLSIRFWKDVPKETKSRRDLEQQLIQDWLPAFNKETRMFWSAPFTNEID